GAVEIRPGAGAAGDGFVVLMHAVAEREIVHRALTGREHTERAVQAIRDDLRGLDVAGDDCSGILRLEHGSRGHDDLDRLETARVHRDLVVHERAEHVEHGGPRDWSRSVEVVRLLRTRAGEVYA